MVTKQKLILKMSCSFLQTKERKSKRGAELFGQTDLAAVHATLLGKGLGRDESRGPGRVAEQGVGAVELVAHPEVCYPHSPVVAQQQVARFQVPVDYLLEVHCPPSRNIN